MDDLHPYDGKVRRFRGSDVNHWTLIYAAAGELAYIGFDQG